METPTGIEPAKKRTGGNPSVGRLVKEGRIQVIGS